MKNKIKAIIMVSATIIGILTGAVLNPYMECQNMACVYAAEYDLSNMAKAYYTWANGMTAPEYADVYEGTDGYAYIIKLYNVIDQGTEYEHEETVEWYYVDWDYIGEDFDGNHVNLTDAYNNADKYFFYESLNYSEKEVYEQIIAAIIFDETDMVPCVEITKEQMEKISSYILMDHPEFFWLEYVGYTYYTETNKIATIVPKYNSLYNDLYSNQSMFDHAINDALNNAPINGSEEEKIKWVTDYIANITEYEKNDFDQNAFSVLVNHRSVCAGYARAAQILLQKLGLVAYYCLGESDNGSGWAQHVWNIVYLNGNYYNLDVCWVDNEYTGMDYNYYLVSDSAISNDHYRDRYGIYLPSCY